MELKEILPYLRSLDCSLEAKNDKIVMERRRLLGLFPINNLHYHIRDCSNEFKEHVSLQDLDFFTIESSKGTANDNVSVDHSMISESSFHLDPFESHVLTPTISSPSALSTKDDLFPTNLTSFETGRNKENWDSWDFPNDNGSNQFADASAQDSFQSSWNSSFPDPFGATATLPATTNITSPHSLDKAFDSSFTSSSSKKGNDPFANNNVTLSPSNTSSQAFDNSFGAAFPPVSTSAIDPFAATALAPMTNSPPPFGKPFESSFAHPHHTIHPFATNPPPATAAFSSFDNSFDSAFPSPKPTFSLPPPSNNVNDKKPSRPEFLPPARRTSHTNHPDPFGTEPKNDGFQAWDATPATHNFSDPFGPQQTLPASPFFPTKPIDPFASSPTTRFNPNSTQLGDPFQATADPWGTSPSSQFNNFQPSPSPQSASTFQPSSFTSPTTYPTNNNVPINPFDHLS